MSYKTIIIFVFFLFSIERIVSSYGHKEPEGKIRHKWLTYLLLTTYSTCLFLAFFEFIFHKMNVNIFITLIGFSMMIIGVILRKISIRTLGNNWSIHIKEISHQQLIKEGPYQYLRHPYYLAVMLELFGVSLFLNSYRVMFFVLFIHFPFLLIRVHLEESFLKFKFGE